MLQIINLDIDIIREKLLECEQIHEQKLYESVYLFIDKKTFVCVQKNYGKELQYISFLYKNLDNDNYKFIDKSTVLKCHEFMDFVDIDKIYRDIVIKLKKVGKVVEIEMKRELWECDNYIEGIKISIDVLPGLKPYIEVTGICKNSIFNFLRIIGFEGQEIKYFDGTPIDYYTHKYGVDLKWIIKNKPKITFNNG